MAQPRRLVGEQRERGRVRLGEAERLRSPMIFSKTSSAVSSGTPRSAAPARKRSRCASSASWLRLRLIARRSPSASPTLKPASAIATSSTCSWKMIAPSVSRERLGEQRMVVRAARSSGPARSRSRRSTYGCTAFPWIGPGRTSATCTVRSSRFSGRVRRRLCICARLSIWKRPTVSASWISRYTAGSSSGMRERSIALPAQADDLVDALLDRREHAEPEQVDLQEAGVGARVLVPLAELAALHRGRLDRDELDERAARDDHPARVLGEVARQAGDLARTAPRTRASAASATSAGVGQLSSSSSAILRGVPAFGDAREPLELRRRQAERLADVADRARATGTWRRSRRAPSARGRTARMTSTISFSRMSRGKSRSMSGTEASSRFRKRPSDEPGRDRIHVREARSGSRRSSRPSCRARARAAAGGAASRPRAPRAATSRGQLEHLPVEEEEPGQAELRDQRELLAQPAPRAPGRAARAGSARRARRAQTRASWTAAGSGPSEKSG